MTGIAQLNLLVSFSNYTYPSSAAMAAEGKNYFGARLTITAPIGSIFSLKEWLLNPSGDNPQVFYWINLSASTPYRTQKLVTTMDVTEVLLTNASTGKQTVRLKITDAEDTILWTSPEKILIYSAS